MLADLYVRSDSWLHRLDPRVKLGALVGGASLLVCFRHVAFLAGSVLLLQGLLLGARIPPARLGWVWRQMGRLLVMVILLWPLFDRTPAPPLATIGPLVVTLPGLLGGVASALRIVGMSFLIFALLFTTPQPLLVRGLVALGLPFDWGLTLAIALRYIPTFVTMAGHIQEAQAARGWDPQEAPLLQRARGMVPVLVALVIGVLRTADTLGMALTARGVGTGAVRTSRVVLRFRTADWAVLGLTGVLVIGLLTLRFGLGIGAQVW